MGLMPKGVWIACYHAVASYGDLELRSCDLNPMPRWSAFDKGDVSFSAGIAYKRHLRIKILMTEGKDWEAGRLSTG